jgi:hypothetical protein
MADVKEKEGTSSRAGVGLMIEGAGKGGARRFSS